MPREYSPFDPLGKVTLDRGCASLGAGLDQLFLMVRKVGCRELQREFRLTIRSPVYRFLFAPRWWEANLALYRILGVPMARRVVMATAGTLHYSLTGGRPNALKRRHRFGGWSNYVMDQDVSGMRAFVCATFFNESVHGLAAVVDFPGFLLGLHGNWVTVTLYILNLYLVLIQRYNRIRVLRCLIRYCERRGS